MSPHQSPIMKYINKIYQMEPDFHESLWAYSILNIHHKHTIYIMFYAKQIFRIKLHRENKFIGPQNLTRACFI